MNLEEYRGIIPDFESFIIIMGEPQPYWIRANTLRTGEDEIIERLEEKGFSFEKYPGLNAYRIVKMPVKHPGATVEHSLGYYYVQDLSSMMPPLALEPEKGDVVLDMAAAPGSKTTQMAEMMENSGTIIANDVSNDRIRALAGNIERLGVTNVVVSKGDAMTKNFGIKFDRILLDAPCTGEGVLRKTPKSRMPGMRDHLKLVRWQKAIIRNAYRHLREGGRLVYSTCTFNPLENEGVVQYAVEDVGFEIRKVDLPVPFERGVREWKDWDFGDVWKYVARVYPHRIDTGGMFIAVLER